MMRIAALTLALGLAVWSAQATAQQSGAVQLQSGQSSAGVQSGGGVAIGGDVRMNTSVGSSVTSATGTNAEASVDIGSVRGGTAVGGDLDMNTSVGSQYTSASGTDTSAKTRIGTVGTK